MTIFRILITYFAGVAMGWTHTAEPWWVLVPVYGWLLYMGYRAIGFVRVREP